MNCEEKSSEKYTNLKKYVLWLTHDNQRYNLSLLALYQPGKGKIYDEFTSEEPMVPMVVEAGTLQDRTQRSRKLRCDCDGGGCRGGASDRRRERGQLPVICAGCDYKPCKQCN